MAIQILKEFPAKRLFSQIEPDGKQPLELERTTAFGYTLFNLTHMLDMSFIGATEGIDIYNAASEDGRSITAALKFTIPLYRQAAERMALPANQRMGQETR